MEENFQTNLQCTPYSPSRETFCVNHAWCQLGYFWRHYIVGALASPEMKPYIAECLVEFEHTCAHTHTASARVALAHSRSSRHRSDPATFGLRASSKLVSGLLRSWELRSPGLRWRGVICVACRSARCRSRAAPCLRSRVCSRSHYADAALGRHAEFVGGKRLHAVVGSGEERLGARVEHLLE